MGWVDWMAESGLNSKKTWSEREYKIGEEAGRHGMTGIQSSISLKTLNGLISPRTRTVLAKAKSQNSPVPCHHQLSTTISVIIIIHSLTLSAAIHLICTVLLLHSQQMQTNVEHSKSYFFYQMHSL